MLWEFSGIIYNEIICIEQPERDICNRIYNNFAISVDWNEHPCFYIIAIIAFVILTHSVVRLLLSPITEFNAYNRFFVMIFDKFDSFLDFSQVD